ncbi:hypothetical protein OG889_40955 [Streptomyces sp. NBC_00481]|uniref:hypothetical protein n=1 Tax=Streptomyces sp. NBC_00481 TaxID=2975755 RepID=UPI002DD7B2EB|nr:hypothetical protein [Streptomyces sp. NBC_00481]WRZ00494.1 hypothetical protein OG889_40955 [Streptomyces sp. NBC_00481]
MHSTRTRLRHGALTACAAALTLLAVGCSKESAGAQDDGCRDNGHWSQRERAAWLRTAVAFRGTAADVADPSYDKASVVVRAGRTGDVRVLCQPLAVQVEFWTLTATTKGTETSFVMRYRLSTDGSRARTVGFPAGLPAGQDGSCTRVLVAAYPGAPLADGELPWTTRDLATSGETDVRFGTARIGAYRLLPPQDSAPCDAGRSTTSPSPAGSTAWNINHP